MFKKTKEKSSTQSAYVCSLFDAESRGAFEVEKDETTFCFSMSFLKKKKSQTEIIVSSDDEKLESLVEFLNDWNFNEIETFHLDCDCGTDLLKFTKLKKDLFNDKCDNCYVDYFFSGSKRIKKGSALEVNITKDQCLVLASQLMKCL